MSFIIERLKKVESIDQIFICTSYDASDDIFTDIAEDHGVKIYRGSPKKVTERMLAVADLTGAESLIRVTGDNIFASTEYLDQQVRALKADKLDYIRMVNVPLGATAEVIRTKALKHCHENMDPEISEYLMLFIFNPEIYKCGVMSFSNELDYSNYTLTVDVDSDLTRTKHILKSYDGDPLNINLSEIMKMIVDLNLENCIYQPSGDIKLPYGEVVPFSEFKEDMNLRI